jgi:MFS family permease
MPEFKPNLCMIVPVMVITSMICSHDIGWGYLEPYIASYLHSFSETITTGKVHMLFFVMEIGQIIAAQMYHLVTSMLGYRETLTFALALTAIAWLICSVSTTIWGFIIAALFLGFSLAFRSLTCSLLMVELMPNNYALAVGLSNLGAPVSVLFWAWAPLLLANPNIASPDIEIRENSFTAYYFGEAVTSRMADFFQVTMTMATVVAP